MDKRRHPRYAVEYAGSFLGNGINSKGVISSISHGKGGTIRLRHGQARRCH